MLKFEGFKNLELTRASMQCNVECRYQLNICSRTEESHNHIHKFSSYLTENTVRILYKD
jgi:hypothetical protein